MAELTLVDRSTSPPGVPDAAERERALDITRSFVVEAPAGSGKTALLIQRFLKLLTDPAVEDPGQVLAITFTRKATHEMRQRVSAQLTAADHDEPITSDLDQNLRTLAKAVLARDRELGWHLLEDPLRLQIQTIDSVCADIVATLPVLSATGTGLQPVEEASALYAAAAHRTLLRLGGEDTALSRALETFLLHRDGSLRDAASLIAGMLAWRDQWIDLIPGPGEQLSDSSLDDVVLPRLERALDLAICRALTRLNRVISRSTLQTLTELAAEMAHSDGYKGNPSPVAFCAGKEQPPGERAEDLEHWSALAHLLLTGGGGFRSRGGINPKNLAFAVQQHHKQRLIELLDQVEGDERLRAALREIRVLPPPTYPREQWEVIRPLFRVLNQALADLQSVFTSAGRCDFPSVAMLARQALSSGSSLETLTFGAGAPLQHLLVDEMQDTSTGQYALIELLTKDWDGRQRTLFLVGDPRQSIYRFRQARVERFISTLHRARLGNLPLETLRLSANFRSQQKLVDAFNQDFAAIFSSGDDSQEEPDSDADAAGSDDLPYSASTATRPESTAVGRRWHLDPVPYSQDSASTRAGQMRQTREHARQISRIIEDWQARRSPSGRPWKIAVLVRKRPQLIEIIAALKSAGIPYRALETDPLAERQEILDLVALTRALLHPADRAAWLALLRSPCCGLTLADLHVLTGSGDPAFQHRTVIELIASRGGLLSLDGVTRLQPFWLIVAEALRQRAALPLHSLIERAWRYFGSAAFASAEVLANVNRYFDLLAQIEEPGGTLDLSLLQHELDRLHAAPSVHPGAVDLSTIHLAKGLEWDVVLVPSLEQITPPNRGKMVSWLELEPDLDDSGPGPAHNQAHVEARSSRAEAPGILAPITARGAESARLNKWMLSVNSAREAEELKRLFYVVATRAREELHLFAAPELTKNGKIKRPLKSLLEAAWRAAVAAPGDLQLLPAEPGILPGSVEQIAASTPPTLQRIPLATLQAGASHAPSRQGVVSLSPTSSSSSLATAPEGSFARRALGIAMHDFIKFAADRIASGTSHDALTAELPAWKARVPAVLRSFGLAPGEPESLSASVLRGLGNLLADPDGRWLLQAHPDAAGEHAVTTLAASDADLGGRAPGLATPRTLRVDRSFLAGPSPGQPGSTHLWIVDYKTSTPGGKPLPQFVAEQRALYAYQLEGYARALAEPGQPVRLALYFPLVPRLDWW